MTDDELTRRLSETLREEAVKITSSPDAYERFAQRTANVPPLRPNPNRRLWLALPVGAIALAAAVVLVVVLAPGRSRSTSTEVASGKTAAASALNGAGIPGGVSNVGPAARAASAAGAGSAGSAGSATVTPSGAAVPVGFAPVSVTFTSPDDGWVLGTAPCASAPCTSIVRTTDGGHTWVGIPAPRATLTDDAQETATSISELRFADPLDGWAFGPGMWATHDGGATWHAVTFPGMSSDAEVSDVEASDGFVQAAVLDDASVRILTSPVSSDSWRGAAVSLQIGAGPVPQVQIVLQGSVGWLIEVDRVVVDGARLVSGQWQAWTPPCASAVGPAVMSAFSTSGLVAACDVGLWSTPAGEHLYDSSDGGASFVETGAAAPARPGTTAGVATPTADSVVLAAGSDLLRSINAGHSWTTVFSGTGSAWSDLGFTTAAQGVAIEGAPGTGTPTRLLMTFDGGASWAAVSF